MVVDVLGRGVFPAVDAAVDHFLFRKGYPVFFHIDAHVLLPVLQHFPLVCLKFHGGGGCEDVGVVGVAHVLDWRDEVCPVVVVVVLELSDFEVALGLGDRGDDVVELLELPLCDVCEAVDFLEVLFIELLVAEDHAFLRDVEDESVELLLRLPVSSHVLLQIRLVGRCLSCLLLPGGSRDGQDAHS